jgi:hypothetical protein
MLYGSIKGANMTKNRQKCEVFSRSMGFIRPIENFNIGKRSEFEERKTFKENIIFSTLRKLFKTKEDDMACGKKKK